MGVICWIVDYQINIHICANTDAVITGGSGNWNGEVVFTGFCGDY